jgi:hypothetical protein
VIILRPHNLHWITGSADDPKDPCAHGGVEFQIDGDTLIRPGDHTFTVSAAAIYLLRSLSQPHSNADRSTEFLFPCCGCMFEAEDSDDVIIVGCNSGVDFEVCHDGDDVVVSARDGKQYRVSATDWTNAVCEFSDAVHLFYAESSPKKPYDASDEKAFQQFLSEWSRRRSAAQIQGQH